MTRQNRIKLRSFRQRMYRHPLCPSYFLTMHMLQRYGFDQHGIGRTHWQVQP